MVMCHSVKKEKVCLYMSAKAQNVSFHMIHKNENT